MLPVATELALNEFASRAESRLYRACRDQLSSNVLVIHSVSWLFRQGKGRVVQGEADFLVLMPQHGLLVIEVKGGGVALDPQSRQWSSVDREGARHPIKDPFKQANSERFALIDQLLGHKLWGQAHQPVTIGHGVMFPDIAECAPLVGNDRPREIIGTSVEIKDIEGWCKRALNFWRRPQDARLNQEEVRLIEAILCAPIDVRPAIGADLHRMEDARIRLTARQAKVLRIIGGRQRAIVSGGAGTGKTLIALEKARQLVGQAKRVLLLCYNRPLADSLREGNAALQLEIMSFHQLCDTRIEGAKTKGGRDLLAEAQAAYPGSGDRHHFDVVLPFALALAGEELEDKFDAVIVDEAQDFSDEYWYAVEDLLRGGESGVLYIFIDENQAIYKKGASLPIQDAPFYLTSNCRNSSPIHRAGYAFYRGAAVDEPELEGPAVVKVFGTSDVDQAHAICQEVARLVVREGVPPGDIVILLAKQPKARLFELIVQESEGRFRVGWRGDRPSGAVQVETVARFKGLEANVVFLWLGAEGLEEYGEEVLYVGLTRAKSVLFVAGDKRAVAAAFPVTVGAGRPI